MKQIKEKDYVNLTSKHTNISISNTDTDCQEDKNNGIPQIRWMDFENRKWIEARKYMYCPNCEATDKNIIRHGIAPNRKQKYKCKNCSKQFTTSINTFIKRMNYYDVFQAEYMKDTNKYDHRYFNATWIYLSSKQGNNMVNNLIHKQFNGIIKDQEDLDTFMFLLVHNAYIGFKNE